MRLRLSLFAALLLACGGHYAKRPAPEPFDAATPALPVLYDVMVPKHATPGGAVTGQTQCGMRMIMHERRGAATRVSTREESFWVDDADLERAPHAYTRCQGPLVLRDSRVSDALARSLTPPVLAETDPWERFDTTLPKSIFERDDDDVSCVEFEFGREKLAAASVVWGFSLESDREVRLTGPTIKNAKMDDAHYPQLLYAPGEEVGFLCLRDLFMARRTKDAWELVPRDVETTGDIWAFSPASAKRWYATRAACEKGLKRGARVSKLPYTGCF